MSKRFFSYLAIVLLVFALYSYNAYQELLYLLILLLALPLMSYILLLIGRYFVRINLTSNKNKVYRGDQFDLVLEIENHGPFYFPLVKIEFNKPMSDDILQVRQERRRRSPRDAETLVVTNSNDGLIRFNSFSQVIPEKPTRGFRGEEKIFRFYRTPHQVAKRKMINFALPQRSLLRNNITVESSNKGTYAIGTDSILLQDLFGFFYLPLPKSSRFDKETQSNTSEIRMDVYPNPNVWKSPDTGQLQEPEEVLISTQNKKVSNEVDTLANVRAYQRGDRMKQIHWKLSARTGEWLARVFEDPRQGGILFALDPKLPDSAINAKNYNNQAAEITAASMKQFARSEGPLSLLLDEDLHFAPGDGEEPVNLYRQLMHWQAQLRKDDRRAARREFKQYANVVDNRLELTETLPKELASKVYRAVVAITARMNDQLVKELIRARDIGSQVILVFLHNETAESLEEVLKPIMRAGIRVYPSRISSLVPYINTELEAEANGEPELAGASEVRQAVRTDDVREPEPGRTDSASETREKEDLSDAK